MILTTLPFPFQANPRADGRNEYTYRELGFPKLHTACYGYGGASSYERWISP